MSESDIPNRVYECGECANVTFGEAEATCCGESMEPVDAEAIEEPNLAVVLREVFGISETGLKVCLCLMEDGESTASDVADQLGIDRSTVGRQLNHLTDIGVMEKNQRILKDGGYVNVYSPVGVEAVRERLTLGLYAWMEDALDIVENVNRKKLDALARADGRGADGEIEEAASIYWDE